MERTLNYTQSARISILIKYKYAGLPITMGDGTFCLLCGTMLGTSAWMFPSTRKTSRMLSSPYITLITRILFFLFPISRCFSSRASASKYLAHRKFHSFIRCRIFHLELQFSHILKYKNRSSGRTYYNFDFFT